MQIPKLLVIWWKILELEIQKNIENKIDTIPSGKEVGYSKNILIIKKFEEDNIQRISHQQKF